MRVVTVGKLSSSGQLIDGGEAARRTGEGEATSCAEATQSYRSDRNCRLLPERWMKNEM